jgi:HAD superfamily hydrolase (TIGR01484 family)
VTVRYESELRRLDQVYAEARHRDLGELPRLLERLIGRPLIAIGSGGSLSVASFAAFLHELFGGAIARAATPLEFLDGARPNSAVCCFSASGRNRDICSAFTAAALSEARPLAGLVLSESSPLHDLAHRYDYSDVIGFGSPIFKDGFLAVASLLASSMLLLRSYRRVLNVAEDDLPDRLEDLIAEVAGLSDRFELGAETRSAVARPVVSLLITPALRSAAVDLESRFVEAALGNLHSADLRNFGHGRHHWFAKRGNETGVVALIGDSQSRLADKTIALLPDAVPVLRIDFRGKADVQALAGLVVGLHLAAYAGEAKGIDPGKPGVPEFGRKLYHLGPGIARPKGREAHFVAAVRRKAPRARLEDPEERKLWSDRYTAALETLAASTIGAVVFDYDGTLCDARLRYEPIGQPIVQALASVLETGTPVGIATGRGASAAEQLQKAIPPSLWDNVYVGCYNGALISPLGEAASMSALPAGKAVLELEGALRADPVFAKSEFRANAAQIAIRGLAEVSVVDAVAIAQRIADRCGVKARATCSSHSIDLVFGETSKLDVVRFLTQRMRGREAGVLRIGDRGRWPGNDADLLDDVLGLSVDEVNPNSLGCWGLTPPGIIGISGTRYYLEAIKWGEDGGRLDLAPARKGVP